MASLHAKCIQITSCPHLLTRYMNTLVGKSVRGQPVSFTDFFGMLLRDTIVQDKEATLSGMRRAVKDGGAPLPLFTSLHVKKNVSAKVFQVTSELVYNVS